MDAIEYENDVIFPSVSVSAEAGVQPRWEL